MRVPPLLTLVRIVPWLVFALPPQAIADPGAASPEHTVATPGSGGADHAPATKSALVVPAAPGAALNRLRQAFYGTVGRASAPRLWMLIDPECSFSMRAMAELQPFISSGKVQLALVPLSRLDRHNDGESTADALAMLSRPPEQMVEAWRTGHLGGPHDAAAARRLSANAAVAEAIRLRRTPTFLWRRADGTEGRLDGLPADMRALVDSLGR